LNSGSFARNSAFFSFLIIWCFFIVIILPAFFVFVLIWVSVLSIVQPLECDHEYYLLVLAFIFLFNIILYFLQSIFC
jgi:hypothetical protein